MTGLIFLLTLSTILVFSVRLVIKKIRNKSTTGTIKVIALTLLGYASLWTISYFLYTVKPIPPGTDICFDDWCVTVTKTERISTLVNEGQQVKPNGQFVIVAIKMSNHARGISQKPSEPKVHIVDADGHAWAYSINGQEAYENEFGKQIPVDEKLELHQSLETILVFDIPKDAKDLKVLIEEGPFITNFLFKQDQEVFLIR